MLTVRKRGGASHLQEPAERVPQEGQLPLSWERRDGLSKAPAPEALAGVAPEGHAHIPAGSSV